MRLLVMILDELPESAQQSQSRPDSFTNKLLSMANALQIFAGRQKWKPWWSNPMNYRRVGMFVHHFPSSKTKRCPDKRNIVRAEKQTGFSECHHLLYRYRASHAFSVFC